MEILSNRMLLSNVLREPPPPTPGKAGKPGLLTIKVVGKIILTCFNYKKIKLQLNGTVILLFFIGVEFQHFINENETGSKLQTGLRGLISISIYYDHDFWCSGGHRNGH